ncbi:MAG: sigma-70 family RNA polymerase sigma factor [Patescibacteria group bacterium]
MQNAQKIEDNDLSEESHNRRREVESYITANYTRLRYMAQRMTRNHSGVEDVLHAALEKAVKYANKFDRAKGDLGGWVGKIIKNEFINFLLRHHRTAEREDELNDNIGSRGNEESRLGTRITLRNILHSGEIIFPPVAYEVIVNGLEYEEAAEELDMPLGTVKSQISRFREKMRKMRRLK